MSEDILMIANPGSRSGSESLDAVAELLGVLGAVRRVKPEHPKQIPDLIREHGPGADRIVLGGGDGTINLALEALLAVDKPVGILALGTANDFARALNIPEDLEQAARTIVAGNLVPVDVGTVNDHRFINAVSIGFGPQTTREMDSETKSRFGVFAYPIAAARALQRSDAYHAKLQCDDKTLEGQYLQITIASGIHYGGGMTIAHDAQIDDGLLNLIAVPLQSRWRVFASALEFRRGRTRTSDSIHHRRCSTVTLETDPVLEVTVDGEFLTSTPLECSVSRRALSVYAPGLDVSEPVLQPRQDEVSP